MSEKICYINIIGAGLAGLTAAKTLAEKGIHVRLFSVQPSERAQSNLAEGGINASLNLMGEDDTVLEHFNDTMKGGCYLADPNMVMNLVKEACDIVMELDRLGVPFHREDGHIIQRNFGGQKKKRTSYAKSSTGKVLTVALIDVVRKYEVEGLVERYSHHQFERLILSNGKCQGVQILDKFTDKSMVYYGPSIMACGGINGMFLGLTTGTTANTADAAASLFSQGVEFANLEFIQYHPTTAKITGKRMLISEAARGEGGRLFYYQKDSAEGQTKKVYFLEDKYGPKGNLMPRDVISREMANLENDVYLDLTGLSDETWEARLSDLREEIIHYLAIDPKVEPVPVSPGIHYFMGGINIDFYHKTNVDGLFAAGECAAGYHGANRLGGNSLLGAIFGGKQAAISAGEYLKADEKCQCQDGYEVKDFIYMTEKEREIELELERALADGLGIMRQASSLQQSYDLISALENKCESEELKNRIIFAKAMLECAINRKESRGAHTRLDFTETLEEYHKSTIVSLIDDQITISFREIPELKKEN